MEAKDRGELKKELMAQLDPDNIPAHVAIIMDGNGRWAKMQGKPRIFGHHAGARVIKKVVRFARDIGIKHLSLYAFSIENWSRPSLEVSTLMKMFKTYFVKEREALNEDNFRLHIVGREEGMAPEILKEAEISEEYMKNNTGLNLNMCINYGGRAEIVDAVKNIMKEGYKPEDVTEELISQHLYKPEIPDVDLMVRTSGEYRISNFHVWRGAYAELYFSDVLWPEFDDVELLKAVISYQGRERRFGKTGDQVKK